MKISGRILCAPNRASFLYMKACFLFFSFRGVPVSHVLATYHTTPLRLYTFFEIQQLQAQVRAFRRGRQQRPPQTSPAPAMDTKQIERRGMQPWAFCTSAPLSFIWSYPVSELMAKSWLISWLLRPFFAKPHSADSRHLVWRRSLSQRRRHGSLSKGVVYGGACSGA